MSDVYIKSPNRIGDYRVRNVAETIANYVERVPSFNVKFAGNTFTLSTQEYVHSSDRNFLASVESQLDSLAKAIEEHLKDEDFKKIKFDKEIFDATPMGQSGGVITNPGILTLYFVTSTYTFSAEA